MQEIEIANLPVGAGYTWQLGPCDKHLHVASELTLFKYGEEVWSSHIYTLTDTNIVYTAESIIAEYRESVRQAMANAGRVKLVRKNDETVND